MTNKLKPRKCKECDKLLHWEKYEYRQRICIECNKATVDAEWNSPEGKAVRQCLQRVKENNPKLYEKLMKIQFLTMADKPAETEPVQSAYGHAYEPNEFDEEEEII